MLAFLLAIPLLALGVTAKPYQIRGVVDPIYHLYLQSSPNDTSVAVLGSEDTSEYFNVSSTIQSVNTTLFVNIGNSTASYKPLYLSSTAVTTAWGLEGDTISTVAGSTYGRQINFLACELDDGYYSIYLQTGSDVPSGQTCSNYQTLHLPCLC